MGRSLPAGGALRAELALMLANQGKRDEGLSFLEKARVQLATSDTHRELLEERERLVRERRRLNHS